ncbi:hypothetical protein JCM11641_004112 [Rhodosporidiobolus odoratus]
MSDDDASAGVGEKQPQNEACTNCRSVKRRCINSGNHAPCVRCTKKQLECAYHQQKRGRKAGASVTARPRKRRAAESPETTEEPEEDIHKLPSEPAVGGDWLADMLRSQQAESSVASNAPPTAAYTAHVPAAGASFLPLPQSPQTSRVPPAPSSHPHLQPILPRCTTTQRSAAPRPPTYPPIYPAAVPSYPGGPSPAAANYPSAETASSPQSAVQATPATGGFSLVKILKENHGGTGENGDRDPPRHSLADAFATEADRKTIGRKVERESEDIVAAGILPESQILPLWDFYFLHLNPMTSLLDPLLHTVDFCRSRSALLFTAILTVASKVALSALYPPSLKYVKMLLGQAFESGVNSLELVQAIATMVFWADPTDDSGARKLAYAIRCAFELGIHKRGKRPLPEDKDEKRRLLNPERTWFYITIADHRFNTQRGLPKMIDNSYRADAVSWLLEHGEAFCPQEAGIVPLVELGRILDFFAVLISADDGLPSMELLKCLEREVEAWRCNWSLERSSITLQPAQRSLVRFYAQVLQWQLGEVNLCAAIKRQSDSEKSHFFDPRNSPVHVFRLVIKEAIKVLETMERELRFMVYSFDSMWVGTASSAIWLTQNLAGMDPRDRGLSLEAISRLQNACTEHSSSPQSMAAYTSRLLSHLLEKAKPTDDVAGASQNAAMQNPSSSSAENAVPSSFTAVQQQPAFVTASLSAPSWGTDNTLTFPATAAGAPGASTSTSVLGGMLGSSTQLGGLSSTASVETQSPSWNYGGTADQQQQADPLGTNFLGTMVAPTQSSGELPFPAADDAFWQSLFPFFATES